MLGTTQSVDREMVHGHRGQKRNTAWNFTTHVEATHEFVHKSGIIFYFQDDDGVYTEYAANILRSANWEKEPVIVDFSGDNTVSQMHTF